LVIFFDFNYSKQSGSIFFQDSAVKVA